MTICGGASPRAAAAAGCCRGCRSERPGPAAWPATTGPASGTWTQAGEARAGGHDDRRGATTRAGTRVGSCHHLRGVLGHERRAGCAAAGARRGAAGSAGTGRPRPACPRPAASRRAGGCPRARSPGPSPVPPLVRARAGSARQNRLNTIADSPGSQPDAVVADRDRGGLRRRPPRSTTISLLSAWSMALVTRLRTIRSTRRTSASAMHGRVGRPDHDLGCRAARRAPGCTSTTRCATSTRLTSSRSSTAAPASKRLISSRSTSSVSNRSSSRLQQLGGARGRRVEAVAGVVQHVAGHPHGGQRRAQLVGDVGDEPALHPGQLLELADLALQVGRHLVERRGRAGPGRPRRDTCIRSCELAGGQPLGDPAGQPDRGDDLPGDQPGQRRRPAASSRTPAVSRARRTRARVSCSLVEREQVVERVGRRRPPGSVTWRADDDARASGWSPSPSAGSGSWCRSRRSRATGSSKCSTQRRPARWSRSRPGRGLGAAPAGDPCRAPGDRPDEHDARSRGPRRAR